MTKSDLFYIKIYFSKRKNLKHKQPSLKFLGKIKKKYTGTHHPLCNGYFFHSLCFVRMEWKQQNANNHGDSAFLPKQSISTSDSDSPQQLTHLQLITLSPSSASPFCSTFLISFSHSPLTPKNPKSINSSKNFESGTNSTLFLKQRLHQIFQINCNCRKQFILRRNIVWELWWCCFSLLQFCSRNSRWLRLRILQLFF